MMNISQSKSVEGYFDFSRVESIEVFAFTTGACSKPRHKVVMTMFSGQQHTWGEYVCNEKRAMAVRDALLNAVRIATT